MALVELKKYQVQIMQACVAGSHECFKNLRRQLDLVSASVEVLNNINGYSEFTFSGCDSKLTTGRYRNFSIEDVVVWFPGSNDRRHVELTILDGAINLLDVSLDNLPRCDHDDFEDSLKIERIGWTTYKHDNITTDETTVYDATERNLDGAFRFLTRTF